MLSGTHMEHRWVLSFRRANHSSTVLCKNPCCDNNATDRAVLFNASHGCQPSHVAGLPSFLPLPTNSFEKRRSRAASAFYSCLAQAQFYTLSKDVQTVKCNQMLNRRPVCPVLFKLWATFPDSWMNIQIIHRFSSLKSSLKIIFIANLHVAGEPSWTGKRQYIFGCLPSTLPLSLWRTLVL